MLHETTQRRVCRIVFLASCVLPTAAVLTAVAQFWMPSSAHQWELPIGQLLDCRVTIQKYRAPRPGIATFDRLTFADPETGTEWARFADVYVEEKSGVTRISVASAEVSMNAGREVSRCLTRLLRSSETREMAVSIATASLVCDDVALRIPNLRAQFESADTGSRVQFWSPENAVAPRLLVERNRQLDPPATRVTVETGANPMPCRMLSAWDCFKQLGEQAQFRGRIELTASHDSVRGHLTGTFTNLRLPPPIEATDFPSQLVVEGLSWSAGSQESFVGIEPTGPVAAILSQLLGDETKNTDPSGEVTWELAPWSNRIDVATRGQRDANDTPLNWR